MKFRLLTRLIAPIGFLGLSACTLLPTLKPDQGRLLATGAVTQVEGAAGTGLVPWAVMTGYGTDRSWGASAFYTKAQLSDFELESRGAAVGIMNRVELSYANQRFDTGETALRLGLPEGYTFEQDIIGAKVRLAGDLVYNQESWLPQIAVGAQYKSASDAGLLNALGAENDAGLDLYISGTKLLLDHSLLLNGTVRRTKANQLGLLGFGGDQSDGHSLEFEGSAALMLSKQLVVGADYRTKPNNLGFAEEDDAFAAYLAFFISKNVSLTGAYVDLGDIALQGRQTGAYGSIQVGF